MHGHAIKTNGRMNPWESVTSVSREERPYFHDGAGDVGHGAGDDNALRSASRVSANKIVDSVAMSGAAPMCRRPASRARAGVGDGWSTRSEDVDVGIVRVRQLREQFLCAIDQLVEPFPICPISIPWRRRSPRAFPVKRYLTSLN